MDLKKQLELIQKQINTLPKTLTSSDSLWYEVLKDNVASILKNEATISLLKKRDLDVAKEEHQHRESKLRTEKSLAELSDDLDKRIKEYCNLN